MFKKIMAKLGKGAAIVDLRYENKPYFTGETLHGEVILHGGEVEQLINELSVRLMIRVRTKNGQNVTKQVSAVPLSGPFKIKAKEEKTFNFSYAIPHDLPLTRGPISYYFDTHLDIQGGLDHIEVDPLVLEAPKELAAIFNALGSLGFREKPTSGKVDTYGQEFSFFPTLQFTGQLNELEIRVSSGNGREHVFMEVDIRHGYRELEARKEFDIDHSLIEEPENLSNYLLDQITELLDQPQLFTGDFSFRNQYSQSGHKLGGGVGGMIGGMGAGLLGGILLSELLDDLNVGEMFEGAADELGMDEDSFDADDSYGDDFGGFDDGDV
ncbi:sporulation protein [Peribacillus sp. SCS-155]|uniref:sporulation protein n=1 Tax=Peribacillus sedimenti TaxID=3115297 RepID=UPI003905F985